MRYAIAVIDIGMTNKKVAVYDEALHELDVAYRSFAPVPCKLPDSTVVDTHDLGGMGEWFLDELSRAAKKFPVKAIAVSTHGATFVCLDKEGRVCAPCVFYTYEPGQAFQDEFYAKAGEREALQRSTYTPPLGSMINCAKGVYFLQKYLPEQFARTSTLLNYPSYWGYMLTGVAGAEPTYLGCHTYLWNHKNASYSGVADSLGIRKLLPQNYRSSYEVLGTITKTVAQRTGLPPDTFVTMGIHDSNASLLPYLVKEGEAGGASADADFIVNSTGTWCVLMHPQNSLEWREGDIGNMVFFNQSALRKPVKTSIFLGGMELDAYVRKYKEINATDEFPSASPAAIRRLFDEKEVFVLPEIVAGSGQFARSKAGVWERGVFHPFAAITRDSYPALLRGKEALWAACDASLVIQTLVALRRAGLTEGMRVFTEGGFRRNELYNALLAHALPKNRVYLTNMKEATSAGAAMTAIMAYEKTAALPKDIVSIEYREIRGDGAEMSETFAGFETYKKRWLELAEGGM